MKIAYDAACAEWAEYLALHPDDLPPTERRALEAHMTSCPTCRAVHEEYGVMADQILVLPDPMLAEHAPRWLRHARRESPSLLHWIGAGQRSPGVSGITPGNRWRRGHPTWHPPLVLWNAQPRDTSKRGEYMGLLRKALLLPVPLCLALAVSTLCWQLGQLAGIWLLGGFSALLAYPGIALPLLLRLLLPIRFRPLLTLKGKLVGIPALLITASLAGVSWVSLTTQHSTHLGHWEVEWWCGLISATCLMLACI